MSLLEIEDLRVTYQTKGGPVPAVRGVVQPCAVRPAEVLDQPREVRLRERLKAAVERSPEPITTSAAASSPAAWC